MLSITTCGVGAVTLMVSLLAVNSLVLGGIGTGRVTPRIFDTLPTDDAACNSCHIAVMRRLTRRPAAAAIALQHKHARRTIVPREVFTRHALNPQTLKLQTLKP